ncbi:hypothetical protein QUF75_03700 [Desulfococcaceae bacterium HSG7]|nr:hypothetical protein [Desulfococcaceae bacterium HSG9]MDM8553816.1 hypothetical protein [Desulfococcaceae bacterium HSG7]
MKEITEKKYMTDTHLGCFSEFNSDDPICNKLCALRLSCVIERNMNARMELFEEFAAYDNMTNVVLQ